MVTTELLFDANFESGNLSTTERIDDTEYNVFIKPDFNLKVRFWFYFRVANITPKLPYIFHILSFSKGKTTFLSEQTPLVRSTSRNKWERIPRSQCFYYVSSKHKCYTSNPVLSFVFQFDKVEDYFFAFSYPFTYSMLTKFNGRLINHKLPFIRLFNIGKTLNGNDFPILVINQDIERILNYSASPAALDNASVPYEIQDKRIVWVSARVHPGEVPSSYILHGLLEFLISNSPVAKLLRNKVIFILIPMVNIDGVIAGFYRGSAAGVDLNRTYYSPDSKQHPETYMMRSLYYELITHGNMRPYRALAAEARGSQVPPVPTNAQELSDELDLSFVSPQRLETIFETNPINRILLRKSIVLDLYNNQTDKLFSTAGAGLAGFPTSASNIDLAGNPTNSASNSTPTDRSLEPIPEASDPSYDTDITSISRTSSLSNYGAGYPDQLLYKASDISAQDAGDLPPSGKQRSTKSLAPVINKPPIPYQFPTQLTNLFSLGYNLDFVVDLHSHSNISGGFLFVNPDCYAFNKMKRTSCELVFPLMLAQNCATFGALNKSFKSSKDRREGSLRRAFMNLGKACAFDNSPYVYCLEVSNSHGPDPAKAGKLQQVQLIGNGPNNDNVESDDLSASIDTDEADKIIYTPSSWMSIGEKLCQTLYELYSMNDQEGVNAGKV
ncbi:Nuclear ATP/GTP-binding protein/ Zinc-binding carboxypeptidase [Giardia duodenalis assemblage B]|uniref:Nuclear ATP/GTP-binding protein/ Zinc-binding carboxypeptidase n=1 Tax=Giardia duodenalis assemblage B TaxID=1394984 RepID=A0A132NPL8_GIAIN|nr:Nuclear ATP/GTP-binding protein/ Zinc-binding carboxypeptidase [Giardia intestinalis assemblage B]